jgi:hypothetical protein
LANAPTEELRSLPRVIRVIRHLGRKALGRLAANLQGNDDKFLTRIRKYYSICVKRFR